MVSALSVHPNLGLPSLLASVVPPVSCAGLGCTPKCLDTGRVAAREGLPAGAVGHT